MKIEIWLLKTTTFPLHLQRRNISAMFVRNNFKAHRIFHATWKSIMEENLMYALTVVKGSLGKTVWIHTYVLTPVNAHMRVLCVIMQAQREEISLTTFAHTQEKSHSHVKIVVNHSIGVLILRDTSAHTPVWNPMPAMHAVRCSLICVIGTDILKDAPAQQQNKPVLV